MAMKTIITFGGVPPVPRSYLWCNPFRSYQAWSKSHEWWWNERWWWEIEIQTRYSWLCFICSRVWQQDRLPECPFLINQSLIIIVIVKVVPIIVTIISVTHHHHHPHHPCQDQHQNYFCSVCPTLISAEPYGVAAPNSLPAWPVIIIYIVVYSIYSI